VSQVSRPASRSGFSIIPERGAQIFDNLVGCSKEEFVSTLSNFKSGRKKLKKGRDHKYWIKFKLNKAQTQYTLLQSKSIIQRFYIMDIPYVPTTIYQFQFDETNENMVKF